MQKAYCLSYTHKVQIARQRGDIAIAHGNVLDILLTYYYCSSNVFNDKFYMHIHATKTSTKF